MAGAACIAASPTCARRRDDRRRRSNQTLTAAVWNQNQRKLDIDAKISGTGQYGRLTARRCLSQRFCYCLTEWGY